MVTTEFRFGLPLNFFMCCVIGVFLHTPTLPASELDVHDLRFVFQNLRVSSPGARTAQTVTSLNYVVGPDGLSGGWARPIVPFPRHAFGAIESATVIESATLNFSVRSDFAEPGESFESEVRLFTVDEIDLTVDNRDAFANPSGDGGDHTRIGTVKLEQGDRGTISLAFPPSALQALANAIQGQDRTIAIAFREFVGDDALDEFVLGIPPAMSLTLTADGASIEVFPTTADFREIPTLLAEVAVHNSGTDALEVSAATLFPQSSAICDPYEILTALPMTILEGGTQILEVQFSPPEQRTRNCLLELDHTDPLKLPIVVSLGTGLEIDVTLGSWVSSVEPGQGFPFGIEVVNASGGFARPRLVLALITPEGNMPLVERRLSLDAGEVLHEETLVPVPDAASPGEWILRAFVLWRGPGFDEVHDVAEIVFSVISPVAACGARCLEGSAN